MPFTVKGMSQLRKDIRNLQPKIAIGIFKEGTAAMAESVAETMRQSNAFEDRTGELRRSIRSGNKDFWYSFYRRRMKIPGGVGVVAAGSQGTGAGYAAAVEYGKKNAAVRQERPFARDAARDGAHEASNKGYAAMKRAWQRNFGNAR